MKNNKQSRQASISAPSWARHYNMQCNTAVQYSVHWSGSIASHKYKHIWKTNIFVDSISEFEYNWFCLQQDYKQWTLYILRVHEFCDEVGKHCRIVLSGGDAGQNWMNTCYNSTEGSLQMKEHGIDHYTWVRPMQTFVSLRTRDVPLYQYCSFWTLFKGGGRSNPC